MRYETDYLMHYGIKGQKWGVRRFQNDDGTLTAEGKARYGVQDGGSASSFKEKLKAGVKKLTAGIKTKVDDKLDDRFPSRMSDQELREKLNRLNMEKQYSQIVSEMNRKPKKEHKVGKFIGNTLNAVLVATATTTLASIAKRSLEIKSDQILAPKRMAKAMKDGFDIYGRKNLEDFAYFKKQKK